jgi:riboflavin synthase
VFTGLIREIGTVEAIDRSEAGSRIRIAATLAGPLEDGDSVSVSGACLTVAAHDGAGFAADVMNQTLSLTTLGELGEGAPVNLEPALRAGDAMGGHIVQGHVDGVGEVGSLTEDGFARRVRVTLPEDLRRYTVEHGSIALDGVSLTVANLTGDGVEVSLIPETLERTTLGEAREGTRLNVEVDQMARYVERLMSSFEGRTHG